MDNQRDAYLMQVVGSSGVHMRSEIPTAALWSPLVQRRHAFQLVSAKYERAGLIVTSNKPFGRWGEVFSDDVGAAAMIDCLVHHAEVIGLKVDSYRLKDRDLGRIPASATED